MYWPPTWSPCHVVANQELVVVLLNELSQGVAWNLKFSVHTDFTFQELSLPAACRLYSRGLIFTRARSTVPEEKWGTTRSLQRRRRLRKPHLKSEFALPQTLSRLIYLVWFVKCWRFFLELNSKGLCPSSRKEKESFCLVFPSLTKREIRHFHVEVVQWLQRNVEKSVMHVQSWRLATINLLHFCRSSCRRRRRRRCLTL